MWMFGNTENGFDVLWTGDDVPTCRFCGEPLFANNVKKFKIRDTGYEGYAVDIECLCRDCRCMEIFGVAVNQDTYDNLKCMELIHAMDKNGRHLRPQA